jgi:hypothetical protein
MSEKELHADLLRLAEWIDEHITTIDIDLPEDAEGFKILPKGIDSDALRALKSTSEKLTRIIYNHLGQGRND